MCDWVISPHFLSNQRRIAQALSSTFLSGSSPVIDSAIAQLDAYFSHSLTHFLLPLLLIGTPFQKDVWNTLIQIPYGHTCSYLQQAQMMHRPEAVRAVATANSRNPISIIIPCHRVIGSNHSLTGYAGGIETKRLLLQHEAFLA